MKDLNSACRLHLKGNMHEWANIAHAGTSQSVAFYKRGSCSAGDKCQFVHKDLTVAPAGVGDTRAGGGGVTY